MENLNKQQEDFVLEEHLDRVREEANIYKDEVKLDDDI